jgi:predicted chitinase
MIISPPFLPAQTANQNDDAWLDSAMTAPPSRLVNTQAPEGSFPLSNKLEWHTGMHLQGTAGADGNTPVRAIADGEVIFVSKPTAANANATDPQNFNPFGESATWTDNGCVILKHTTEIGANGQQATALIYYSLYMHLNWIGQITPSGQTTARPLQVGDRIWRKDEVGRAGQIYGHAGQVHIEVCMDEAQLTQLIGRPPAWVDPANIPAPTADGRIDAVFGAIWFYLPANTPTAATQPTSQLRAASQTTLGQALWVRMRYELGECIVESYDNTGTRVGALPRQADVEYNLYTEATHRHGALAPADQAHSSPSGWYELLRFGRNLGRGSSQTDKDPLPANAGHWRRIPGPDGQPVWADLNAVGSYKFSDADFLPIQGWNFINDDTSPNDQRCDSNNLKNLIADPDTNNGHRMETEQLALRLGNSDVARKLKRMVCNFPSEWDQTTIATRYAFVQQLEPFQQNPAAWAIQEAHLKAISFPNLPAEYIQATWRFQPREFIGAMRRCGWLSKRELLQLVPSHAIRQHNGNLWEPVPWAQNAAIPTTMLPSLNRTLRKYGIVTPMRQAGFFGNSIQETTWLSVLREGGGSGYWYTPWHGRGLLQLTHPDNYIGYWRWRGRAVPTTLETSLVAARNQAHAANSSAALHDANFPALTPEMINWRSATEGSAPEPEYLNENRIAPPDSAGYYWAKLGMARYADDPATQMLERVSVPMNQGTKIYYRSQGFWKVSASVNLPGAVAHTNYQGINGFDSRCCAYGVATAVLAERLLPNAQGQNVVSYPEGYTRRAT